MNDVRHPVLARLSGHRGYGGRADLGIELTGPAAR
jgi:hypothetical protein